MIINLHLTKYLQVSWNKKWQYLGCEQREWRKITSCCWSWDKFKLCCLNLSRLRRVGARYDMSAQEMSSERFARYLQRYRLVQFIKYPNFNVYTNLLRNLRSFNVCILKGVWIYDVRSISTCMNKVICMNMVKRYCIFQRIKHSTRTYVCGQMSRHA